VKTPSPLDEEREVLQEMLDTDGWRVVRKLLVSQGSAIRKRVLWGNNVTPSSDIQTLNTLRNLVNSIYSHARLEAPDDLKAVFE
jgi:hypothetical protein